jgi:hypothetical protein
MAIGDMWMKNWAERLKNRIQKSYLSLHWTKVNNVRVSTVVHDKLQVLNSQILIINIKFNYLLAQSFTSRA